MADLSKKISLFSISAIPAKPKGRRGESISLAKSIRPFIQPKSHPWKKVKK